MENLGKANVSVEILNVLPGITRNFVRHEFDVSAFGWSRFQNSPFFPPLLTENITDQKGGFSACFPAKRKYYINNFIAAEGGISDASSNYDNPYILWAPIQSYEGVVSHIRQDYPFYILVQPGDYTDNDYIGPKWIDSALDQEAPPNDASIIKEWYKLIRTTRSESERIAQQAGSSTTTTTSSTTTPSLLPKMNWVYQSAVRDGLWWGIESTDFLKENMPFWVNIKRSRPPSGSQYETLIIISLGSGTYGKETNGDKFDIILSNNKRPRVIDYYTQSSEESTDLEFGYDNSEPQFENELAKILTEQENIEVGVMTVAGRLVVWINQIPLIYTRVDKSSGDNKGTLRICKIPAGRLRIYGTNTKMSINVCPMTFAPAAVMALEIAAIPPGDQGGESHYHGVKNDGTIEGTVCRLPTPPDVNGTLFGVDCRRFKDADGTEDYPTVGSSASEGSHRQGYARFIRAKDFNIKATEDLDFYIFYMIPDFVMSESTTESIDPFQIPYGGTPYFYKLKGAYQDTPLRQQAQPIIVDEDVLTVSETSEGSDYYSTSKRATVVLYNEGGKYDYLTNRQYGVTISWGWNDSLIKTFTGIIKSASVSELPGRETITIDCEDYMYILKETPIINSPFYDGMLMFSALSDLAQRGGVLNINNDMDDPMEYFLPSGYTFSQPSMRFEQVDKLFTCMTNIIERSQAFMYFDENGEFHVDKLPGGLFSVVDAGTPLINFTRDPDATYERLILDEKNVEYNFDSTFNQLSIFSVDRDTRNAIIHGKGAAERNILLFKKTLLHNEAALGEVGVVRAMTEEYARRLFYLIRKTSFKTVGVINTLKPFDFITVDGDEYRILSIVRQYSSDSNNFTNEYNAEWLGGKT